MARPLKWQVAIVVIAEWFNITQKDLLGKRRTKTLVDARHTLYYVMNQHIGMSNLETGEALDGRDHSTIISGVNRISALINGMDAEWREDVREIVSEIEALDRK